MYAPQYAQWKLEEPEPPEPAGGQDGSVIRAGCLVLTPSIGRRVATDRHSERGVPVASLIIPAIFLLRRGNTILRVTIIA